MLLVISIALIWWTFLTVLAVEKSDTEDSSQVRVSLLQRHFDRPEFTHIQKATNAGKRDLRINVPLPTKALKKIDKKTYPKNYWTLEQRVVRKANKDMEMGKYQDKNEALLAAHEQIKQKFKKEAAAKREKYVGPRKQNRPKGWYSKTSWTFRRMAGILKSDNTDTNNLADARERAVKEYKERIARQNEVRKRKAKEKKMNHAKNH